MYCLATTVATMHLGFKNYFVRCSHNKQSSFMWPIFLCTSVLQWPSWCSKMYGTEWAKSTFIVATEQHRQLTIHRLRIIILITGRPTYANNGWIAACVAPWWCWKCFSPIEYCTLYYTNMVAVKKLMDVHVNWHHMELLYSSVIVQRSTESTQTTLRNR